MIATYFPENRGLHDPNVFEGDMILTPEQRYKAEHGMDVDSDRKRGSSRFRLWPGGVVVYAIQSTLGRFLSTSLIKRYVRNSIADNPSYNLSNKKIIQPNRI